MLDETDQNWRRRVGHWVLLVFVFFVAFVPTLQYIPFSDGMENFNVLPSLEVARDGQWAVPTLWGRARFEKPPLAEWLCAAGILAGGKLEFAARWGSLLLACLTLVVVYEWARYFGGWRAGLIAAIAAGTTLFFIRFGRRAAYDGPLMFWVALTNLALTWGLFGGKWIRATIVGGIGLGGAMMTKGPPGLLHTVLPFGVCCLGYALWRWKGMGERFPTGWLGKAAGVIVLVTVISVLFVLPWALALLAKFGSVQKLIEAWQNELTLGDEQREKLETPLYVGMVFFWLVFPWIIWFVGAAVVAVRERTRRGTLVFLLVMALLPVVLHSLKPPMRDRYLVPMLPAAAVAVGLVYQDYMRRFGQLAWTDKAAAVAQFVIVAGFAVAYPLTVPKMEGSPIGWGVAIALAAVGAVAVGVGFWQQRRTPWALVVSTLVGMMVFQVAYTADLARKPDPSEAIAQRILAKCGDVPAYYIGSVPPPRSLAIYLGRTVRGVGHMTDIPQGQRSVVLLDGGQANAAAEGTPVMQFADGKTRWRVVEVD